LDTEENYKSVAIRFSPSGESNGSDYRLRSGGVEIIKQCILGTRLFSLLFKQQRTTLARALLIISGRQLRVNVAF